MRSAWRATRRLCPCVYGSRASSSAFIRRRSATRRSSPAAGPPDLARPPRAAAPRAPAAPSPRAAGRRRQGRSTVVALPKRGEQARHQHREGHGRDHVNRQAPRTPHRISVILANNDDTVSTGLADRGRSPLSSKAQADGAGGADPSGPAASSRARASSDAWAAASRSRAVSLQLSCAAGSRLSRPASRPARFFDSRLPAGGGAYRGWSASRSVAWSSSTRLPIAASAARETVRFSSDGGSPRRPGRARRARRPCTRCGSRSSRQCENIGDVGGHDEAVAGDLREASGRSSMPSRTDAVRRATATASSSAAARCRSAGGSDPSAPNGVQGDEYAGKVADGLPGLRADPASATGTSSAASARSPALRVRELEQAELLAGVDLEVLPEVADVSRRSRGSRQLEMHVACHAASLACTTSASLPSSSASRVRSIDSASLRAARARRARPDAESRARTVGVPERRVGVRQQQMAHGRRLRRLQIGVVRRERRSSRARVPGERRSLVDEGVVQLARTDTGRQAERDAKGLAPRAAGTEPAGGGPADAPLQLGFPRR